MIEGMISEVERYLSLSHREKKYEGREKEGSIIAVLADGVRGTGSNST